MHSSQNEEPPACDRSSSGRTASLVGWYGFENAGDDAFFAILCKWMIEEFSVDHISVSGCHERLPKTVDQLPANIYGNETKRALGRVERFFHEPKNLFGHNVVVMGGGSILSSRRFWWLAVQAWTLKALRSMRLNRAVLVAIGISIGPFRRAGDSFWCRKALRSFDLVMVRDVKSADIGQQYGLKRLISSMDLALVLPGFYEVAQRIPRTTPTAHPIIGFSIVDRDTENGFPEIDEVKRARIVESLLGVAEEFPQAKFRGFVFCKHGRAGDYAATDKILKPLREAGYQAELVEYDNDPVSFCGQLADLDAMICNRMHSFVFACITQTPAVMISYAPKMEEFAKTVELPSEFFFEHSNLDAKLLQRRLAEIINKQTLPCDPQVLKRCCEKVMADLNTAAEVIRNQI